MKPLAVIVATLVLSAPALAFDWKDFTGDAPPTERTWKEFDAPASADEMKALGVDTDLAEMMRNRTSGPGTLLRGADDDAPIGLQWPTESTASVALVRQLRDELVKRGFVIFVAERNFGTGPDHVGLMQGAEPESVIVKRVVPPGLARDAWLERLRGWRKDAPWDLVGVGADWLEIEFREAPPKPERWLEEIGRIAPASFGGAPEGRDAFRETLVRTRRALLWWKLPEATR